MTAPAARREKTGTAVTPGNYDGVHVGHRALLDAARRYAEGAPGTTTVALFFNPHPAVIVDPAAAPTPLTTLRRRQDLLRRAGADRVEALPFDQALANVSAERFATDVLARDLSARHVVVGPDFRFGRRAEGDVGVLRSVGAACGFTVHVVDPVTVAGERVSSTRIRSLLRDGEASDAAALLARYHDVDGEVVLGDQRGRTLGFPTANLQCEPVLLPADGVYAVAAVTRDEPRVVRGGVANLGVRPTMNAGRSVEVHLFDFDGDLYGTMLRVAFVERVRSERRFTDLDALKAQIGRDTATARSYIERARKEWLAWL